LPSLPENPEDEKQCVYGLSDACPIRIHRQSVSMEELANFCKSCPLMEELNRSKKELREGELERLTQEKQKKNILEKKKKQSGKDQKK